jgi:hypothetical protein
MRSIDEFRLLLRDARRYVHPGPVLLSALGLALRRADAGFDPQAFGHEKLGSLLRLVEDVGRIDADRFVFADERAGSPEREENLRLRSDIWRAVTEFRPAAPSQLDLADFVVRSAATDAALVTEEPHRFLALPHADFAYQRQLALDFIAEHRPELAAEVERLLEDGFTGVNALFDATGLTDAWRVFRMHKVVDLVVDWADKHGVPIGRLRSNDDQRASRPRARPAPIDVGSNGVDVRAVVHAAVDMMSPSELAALPIPPVYLAIAAARIAR